MVLLKQPILHTCLQDLTVRLLCFSINQCPSTLKFQDVPSITSPVSLQRSEKPSPVAQWPEPPPCPPCLRDHEDHSVLLTEVQTNREVSWCFWRHRNLLLDLEGCRGLTAVFQDVHDVNYSEKNGNNGNIIGNTGCNWTLQILRQSNSHHSAPVERTSSVSLEN